MRLINIIGSTGSIGQQTLDVVEHLPGYKVVGLTANRNVDRLVEQVRRYRPEVVAVGDKSLIPQLRLALQDWDGEVLSGPEGILELAARDNYDTLVSAAVGAAGIRPTLAAIQTGKTVALANKETLVAAGSIVMAEANKHNVRILPVDSEHSAIFQCLEGRSFYDLKRIHLTASGGPFRRHTIEQLTRVSFSEALAHPTWTMGGKITIDSATLMNKGLEVIEAHWLFGVDYDQIQVVIHPQSIVHSMIELMDGSLIAQLGPADMRLPIQLALVYPKRIEHPFSRMNLLEVGRLEFEPPDVERFPSLALAYEAGKVGGTMPAVLNAANELAVDAFLTEKISFTDIPRMVELSMGQHQKSGWIKEPSLDEILQSDEEVRSNFGYWLRRMGH
jgi:1-deoxy-D-xylulose-5-phosphate reductoisomerase